MSFPEATWEKWRAQVERDLAGASFDKQLVQMTLEGLAVAPLHLEEPSGARDRETRGRGFQICVRADQTTGLEGIVADVQAGAEAVWVPAGEELGTILAHLDGLGGRLIVDPVGSSIVETIEGLLVTPRAEAAPGFVVQFDPLSCRVAGRLDDAGLDREMAALAEVVNEVDERAPGSTSVVVSTLSHHDAGADAADELAIALSTGAAYLEALVGRGVSLARAARQITLQISVGRDTFLELCKLRALRICWSKLVVAAGLAAPPVAQVHAVCSRRTLTIRDPWVNMLRTTTQMFAAILGGADLITPTAFDEASGPSGELGRRVARNTGLVLREESHLGRVLDPAGGSYFFETLTDALAREAWARFQTMERNGGIAAQLTDGRLRARLEATWQTRLEALAKRKTPVLGVSEFANLDETLPRSAGVGPNLAPGSASLPVHRDAEAFEALRLAADARLPMAVLSTLGPLSESRPRVGFAAGFFAAGGIRTRESEALDAAPLVCLCGSDDRYAAEGVERARALKLAGAQRVLLAGRPGALEPALREAGVDGFLFAGCDVLAILQDLLGTTP